MVRISKHLRNRIPQSPSIPQPNLRRLTTVNGILPVLRSLARDHASIVGFSSREQILGWLLKLATRQRLVDFRTEDVLQALLAEHVISRDEVSEIFFVDGKCARRWVRILTSPIAISDREPRQRRPPADGKPCILAADQLYAALRIDPL